ncbi:alpha/beta hydrolase [Microcoleus sp. FACHB-68]|uniref:alpha/beta hydrolase n=1 Tax=Microcoleus sp. FACHB-68 TaxID=2692826 RepID=UPI0016857E7F|nr:alpha/beta hydrolase [Microcoleus sp. FACHB-68]MBD1939386.1 alpha/beta hydrolase [Microcoleus sp. FACHB-68]
MKRKTLRHLLLGEFSFKRLGRSAIIIYAFVCFYAYFFTDRLIFQPPVASYEDSRETIKLISADGIQIAAIYLPNREATHTILYSHGNAEDLGNIRWMLEDLQKMGFAVFAYDYRGYGISEGKATEQGAYGDINAAYNYLTQKLGVSPARIIIYGRSVGSGPSVNLASRVNAAGLILENPFLSAFRVITRIPIVPFDKFSNIDKIQQVRCPVLVMHGTADDLIPFWHGQQLFAAANEPKRFLWVEGAGHNDVMEVAGDQYAKALREFVQLLKTRSLTSVSDSLPAHDDVTSQAILRGRR